MSDTTSLSDREIQILRLVTQGKSNKEIASELYISINTVKVHLTNVYQKLNVYSRTEAALYAINTGIVPSNRSPEIDADTTYPPGFAPTSTRTTIPRSKLIWRLALVPIGLLILFLAIYNSSRNVTDYDNFSPPVVDTRERWQILQSFSQLPAQHTTSAYKNIIYSFSGVVEGKTTTSTYAFDTIESEWIHLTEKPNPVANALAINIDESIYILGGKDDKQNPSVSLDVYDTSTNRWETKTSLPVPLEGLTAFSWHGNLYALGGAHNNKPSHAIYRYSLAEDSWQQLGDISVELHNTTAIVTSNALMLFGGEIANRATDAVYLLKLNQIDPSIAEIKQLSSMPTTCTQCRVMSWSDFVFLVESGYIWQYQFEQDAWVVLSQLDEKYTQPDVSITLGNDGYLYFMGINSPGETNVERFKLLYTVAVPNIVN